MEYKRINRNGVKTLGKTWVLFCLFAMMSLNVHAQDMKFGYFSYQEVFTSMSSYALAQQNIQELKSKYEAETKRSEDEFNQKYEDFLEGMQNYAPTILKKRQAELQDFMARNIAFKEESERLLKQAEKDALEPVHKQLADATRTIAERNGYAFVMNTDNHALPYIKESMGEDITQQLITLLK
jgi:outer membrane protein